MLLRDYDADLGFSQQVTFGSPSFSFYLFNSESLEVVENQVSLVRKVCQTSLK